MRLRVLGLALALLVSSIGGVVLGQSCQFVHVVDSCGLYLQVYRIGEKAVWKRIELQDGGSHELTDVDFATAPGAAHHISFVTQGRYLRVIDHELSGAGAIINTIDVANAAGLPALKLTAVASAPGLEIPAKGGASTQYAVYLIGSTAQGPHWIALDQGALISGEQGAPAVLGKGSICPKEGECASSPIDVVAGSAPLSTDAEEVFISTMAGQVADRYQQYYRLARGAAARGPWVLESLPQSQGSRWTGATARHLGLALDRFDETAVGVFKMEGQIGDLRSSRRSDALGALPGSVRLWGPSLDGQTERLQIVATGDHEAGELMIAPLWKGAGPGPMTNVLEIPAEPSSLDLSSQTADQFWVYVSSRHSSSITAAKYWIEGGGAKGLLHRNSVIDYPNKQTCPDMGCPVSLAIGASVPDAGSESCARPVELPGCPEPPIPCCLDEHDPDPRCDDCTLPGDGDIVELDSLIW